MRISHTLQQCVLKYKKETNEPYLYLLVDYASDRSRLWLEAAGFDFWSREFACQGDHACLLVQGDENLSTHLKCLWPWLNKHFPLQPCAAVLICRTHQSQVLFSSWHDLPFYQVFLSFDELPGAKQTLLQIGSSTLSEQWHIQSQVDWERLLNFHQRRRLKALLLANEPHDQHAQYHFIDHLRKAIPEALKSAVCYFDAASSGGYLLASEHWSRIKKTTEALPLNQAALKLQLKKQIAKVVALLGLSLLLVLWMVFGFTAADFQIQSLSNQNLGVERDLPSSSLQAFLSIQDQWLYLNAHLPSSVAFGLWVGDSSQKVINERYNEQLKDFFVVYLRGLLYQNLQHSLKENHPTHLLQALSAYLMVSGAIPYNQNAFLKAVHRLDGAMIEQQFKGWAAFSVAAKALSKRGFEKTPLDNQLVNAARDRLKLYSLPQLLLSSIEGQSRFANVWRVGPHFPMELDDRFSLSALSIKNFYRRHQGMLFKKQLAESLPAAEQRLDLVSGNVVAAQSNSFLSSQVVALFESQESAAWDRLISQIHFKPFLRRSDARDALANLSSNSSVLNLLVIKLAEQMPKSVFNELGLSIQQLENNSRKTHPLRKILQHLRAQLLVIRSKDQQSLALAILSGNNQPLLAFQTQLLLYPEPIQRWLKEVGLAYERVIFKVTYQPLSMQWRATVWRFYLDHLRLFFPFSMTSTREVSLKKLKGFLKPGGLLDQDSKSLLPFIQNGKWRNSGDLAFSKDHQLLREYHYLKQLQGFFYPGNKKIGFTLKLKPLEMTAGLAQLRLSVPQAVLVDEHGDNAIWSIRWPLNTLTLRATDMSGQHWIKRFLGPWSLFRFLSLCHQQAGTLTLSTPAGKIAFKLVDSGLGVLYNAPR